MANKKCTSLHVIKA